MKLSEALNELVYVSRMNKRQICEAAGFNNSISIRKPIARGDMNVSTLARFANVAGYRIMLVKDGSLGTVPPIPIDFDFDECEDD